MKKILFTILSLLCVSGVYANPVTESEALQKVRLFLSKRAANGAMYAPAVEQNYTLAYSCTNITNEDAPNGVLSSPTPFFYVFNGERGGFIIVSGDDRTVDILGYADTGSFDITKIPDNMRWFLSGYAEQIASLGEDDGSMPHYRAPENPTETTAVAPLMQTKWDQGSPYNKFCPPIPFNGQPFPPTGCVATAMAQIMKYYKFPQTGTGNNCYTLPGNITQICADFGATTYDWNNMLTSYWGSTTTQEQDAVATLMFHCGVSVNMCYACSENGSGAQSSAVSVALKKYFGYDPDILYVQRSNSTDANWENMLKAELDAGRPVYYSGSNNQNGHAFVCDGYNDDGKFHFNWGWGGYSDGYYKTTALNPGGPQSGHFNYNQAAVIKIKPVEGTVVNLVCDSMGTDIIVRNQTSNFHFSIINNSEIDYNSLIALDIIKDKIPGNYQTIYQQNTEFIAAGTKKTFNEPKAITLPLGDYFLLLQYKKGTNWYTLYNMPVTVVANSTKTTDLICNYVQKTNDATLTTGTTGNFKASITNNSTAGYNSKIRFDLMRWDNDGNGKIISQMLSQDIYQLAAGETKEITFSSNITVSAGSYYLVVKYDKSNSASGNDLDILSYNTIVDIDNATGFTDNTFTEIVLYPNPAKEQLFVKSDENIKNITIFDMLGRVISSNKVIANNIVSVDVSSLSNGMYLLRAETDKGSKIMKFYKK